MNIFLIIVGLVICFGGIYFRRICAGIMGLTWGSLGALTIILLTSGMRGFKDSSALVLIIICGVVLGIVSAIHYKAFAAVNGFALAFASAMLIMTLSNNIDSTAAMIVIAIICGLTFGGISFKFYDYSFIIITALSGAFIASVGIYGLVNNCDVGDILNRITWRGAGDMTLIVVGTIVLGIAGFIVQRRRLLRIA